MPRPDPIPSPSPTLRRELRLWHLILFNVSAVVGIRWLAAAAQVGPGSLSLWLLAVLAFFLPSALVVASLSARFPEEGGFYVWTKRAFGPWHGFLCAWLYFVSNILYFPTLLLSGVAMASYMFGQSGVRYSENPWYAIPVTFTVLWAAFLANFFGLRVGKWTGILGGTSTYLVGGLLVVFGVMVAWRFGSATHFHFLPQPTWANLNFWSQIALAMTGLELAPILGGEIYNPERNVPKAAWISGFGCAGFYIAGTAALLALLPQNQISAMTGLAQAGNIAGARFGANWLSPCFALLITIGVTGQLSTYIAGNTRLPYALGIDRHLPEAFARLHPRWHTPHISIMVQCGLASVLLLIVQLGENLRAGYQILVDMVVVATLLPFVYIFVTGFKFGQRLAGTAGALLSIAGVVLSAVPPPGVSSVWLFELKVVGGSVLLAILGRAIFMRHRAAAE
ncbi:MAG TPA: APC family permease [Bryobacteraceae bacterium]|nr:APC family permease [Bryobacteraceae bacterium]